MEPFTIHPKSLYKFLEKKDLDPTNKLTNDEWDEFIDNYNSYFSEEVHKLGVELLRVWISEGHLEKYREVKRLREMLDDY